MAENEELKFKLESVNERIENFEFNDAALNFSTSSPKGFIWNETDVVPPEFVNAGVFSSLEQNFIGYNPLERDRFEIQIYSAKIFPTRIAMAAGYSAMLASHWGKLDFGVKTHSPEFGEVLGGDNSSGTMIVSRITTIRRGDHLLIIRLKFNADYFSKYVSDIAAFLGTISFNEKLKNDPIIDNSKHMKLGEGILDPVFRYSMPNNWELLPFEKPNEDKMLVNLWVDVDDPNRNSGAMIFIAKPENKKSVATKEKVDQQIMNDLSYTYVKFMLENLLPNVALKIEPREKSSFGDLDNITIFNSLFVYKVIIHDVDIISKVNILMTVGDDGTIITTAVFSGGLLDLYSMGTRNHADYVQGKFLQYQIAYWQNKYDDAER